MVRSGLHRARKEGGLSLTLAGARQKGTSGREDFFFLLAGCDPALLRTEKSFSFSEGENNLGNRSYRGRLM